MKSALDLLQDLRRVLLLAPIADDHTVADAGAIIGEIEKAERRQALQQSGCRQCKARQDRLDEIAVIERIRNRPILMSTFYGKFGHPEQAVWVYGVPNAESPAGPVWLWKLGYWGYRGGDVVFIPQPGAVAAIWHNGQWCGPVTKMPYRCVYLHAWCAGPEVPTAPPKFGYCTVCKHNGTSLCFESGIHGPACWRDGTIHHFEPELPQ